jgi:hypothetical protein
VQVRFREIVAQYPQEWSNGIFRVFANIKQDSVIHFKNLDALFPNHLREDLYGALLLGWNYARQRYQIILVAESVQLPVAPLRDLFDVNLFETAPCSYRKSTTSCSGSSKSTELPFSVPDRAAEGGTHEENLVVHQTGFGNISFLSPNSRNHLLLRTEIHSLGYTHEIHAVSKC